jgi:hypothetical protein
MIESICDQEDIVTANIRSVKLSSPDVSPILIAKSHVGTQLIIVPRMGCRPSSGRLLEPNSRSTENVSNGNSRRRTFYQSNERG